MEYLTGVAKKETLEISELLAGDLAGQKVKVNGAVHTIRDMGTVAFVVLRKEKDCCRVYMRKAQPDLI